MCQQGIKILKPTTVVNLRLTIYTIVMFGLPLSNGLIIGKCLQYKKTLIMEFSA
jgi:hypothetical protein